MSQNRTTCVREWAAPASSRALGVWVLQPCPHTRNNKQTDVCTSQHFTLQQLSYGWDRPPPAGCNSHTRDLRRLVCFLYFGPYLKELS